MTAAIAMVLGSKCKHPSRVHYKLTCLHPHVLVYFYKVAGAALDYYCTVATIAIPVLKQLGPSTNGSTRFRNPQALSSALAGTWAPQPRAFGFLNPVDPLVSVPNYYVGVAMTHTQNTPPSKLMILLHRVR